MGLRRVEGVVDGRGRGSRAAGARAALADRPSRAGGIGKSPASPPSAFLKPAARL